MMPSSAELARMRSDMEDATLPDTCNILSLTQASDNEGGLIDTWGTATANVACRLDSVLTGGVGLYGTEQNRVASIKPYSTWTISLPHGTAITAANRVECNSSTFNVVEVDSARSWLANVRATLERV